MKKSEAIERILPDVINGRPYICNQLEVLVYLDVISSEQFDGMRKDIREILKKKGVATFEGYCEQIANSLRPKSCLISREEAAYRVDLTRILRIKYCELLIARYKQEEQKQIKKMEKTK